MSKVLTIGPDYRTLKGGIASVLAVNAKYDKNFTFLPSYRYENNILNILLFPKYILTIIFFFLLNKEYEIVHIHGASKISFYRKYIIFLLVKCLLKKKVIYHIHGGGYHLFLNKSGRFIQNRVHHMVDSSDAIICLSSHWKKFYEENFNPKKVYILNNMISFPKEKYEKIQSKTVTFLFLGYLYKAKGIFDLLEVIADNKEYFNNKIKMIIGGDGDVGRLRSMIKQADISNIVKYVGWIEGDEKEKLLSESDIYILPSYTEGLPISILEAMSNKMPIISTPVGGIPEIVQENINGILIKPGDKNALFASMKFFIEHKNKIEEYGNQSFQRVKDFLPNKVLNDLYKIYEDVLQ